ncbi:hypothetical protein M9H77_17302 [Catharanthus roseus]|uniref:Uncharacterized protein n=1 Tax=Catharanthus roseus TaxID=4058 RepID=A0ACC0B488_CATRO|nr:hypothetical protein M9H77_17302 [Catharanthus roseus]
MTLTSPPEVTATKGRQKTSSTKRDKLYWKHVSITYRKIQKSSGFGSCGRGRPPRAPRGRGRGRNSRRSSLSSVIDPSPCSTFPYTDAFSCFVYPFIENRKNVNAERVYELIRRTQWWDRHSPPEHWLDTPNSLYVIANAFNLCVVLIARIESTTVLPLYSYSDRTVGTPVRVPISRYDGASSHNASINAFSRRTSCYLLAYKPPKVE